MEAMTFFTQPSALPYSIEPGKDHQAFVQARLESEGLSNDFEIVLPKPNQLQLDYDSPRMPDQFDIALGILLEAYDGGADYHTTISKSGNTHVTIDLPVDIDDVTRVAWQAIFGSDYRREGLSLKAIKRGQLNTILLIERKVPNASSPTSD